jgi:hypothetical protein
MAEWSFYDYNPTKAGAIVAILCFGASAAYHIFQLVKMKCYFFTTFIVGAISKSIVAYILR